MATLDSAAFLVRARAAVGTVRYPQGMCLNFVWLMAGGIQSIPPALGRMDTAQHAWEAVEEKDRHHGDWNPPAGVACFFGPSPTRTDRNKNAGDVVVSIGNGLCIATDSAGPVVGIMTLAARAKQIQRPYLGWSNTLGGHRFSAAAAPVTPGAVQNATSTIASIDSIKEIAAMSDSFIVSYAKSGNSRNGIVLANLGGKFQKLTGEQWGNYQVQQVVKDLKVVSPTNDREWDLLKDLCKK